MKDLCNWKWAVALVIFIIFLVVAARVGFHQGYNEATDSGDCNDVVVEYTSEPLYLSTEVDSYTGYNNWVGGSGRGDCKDQVEENIEHYPTLEVKFKSTLPILQTSGWDDMLGAVINALADPANVESVMMSGFMFDMPDSINHTDTPEPVCPSCGEKDNYKQLYERINGGFWHYAKQCYGCGNLFFLYVSENVIYTSEKLDYVHDRATEGIEK